MQANNPTDLCLLFETSWEVCNKIGGIYTVLSTKARELHKQFSDKLIFVGPNVWTADSPSPYFEEDPSLLEGASRAELPMGVKFRTGRWKIPGSPIVALIDYKSVFSHLNEIYGEMWNLYKVDSLHAYGDYDESCAFAVASAIAIKGITEYLKADPEGVLAHFDEWTTGMGLLRLQADMPQAATVFTTHATSIGRSICGNGKPLYEYFHNYNGDQMARELNMESKHSLEKAAAMNADCFTTVSEVTARECTQLLGVTPDVVTPNGFEPEFVPDSAKGGAMRRMGRKKLLDIATKLTGVPYDNDTFIIATSGRNEYRNKGLDLFIDSMEFLGEYCRDDNRQLLAFILVPAWTASPNPCLTGVGIDKCTDSFMTHSVHNPYQDSIACRLRQLQANNSKLNMRIIYVPCYLDGHDGVVNISYYDLLPALDATVFASYYEPWGYTPLESIAFGVPTVTTDKAGFGQWALDTVDNSLEKSGVKVVERNDNDYLLAKQEIAGSLREYYLLNTVKTRNARKAAKKTASLADWKFFIHAYDEAFKTALRKRTERLDK
ncbi:MAG: glycogen/starch synthase [Muribaculum sp.]|nr:glycogen/starch synthase [Muribaculum sp.]